MDNGDSGFDWDSLRPPPSAVDRRQAVMTRLAWIVLVLLSFCPLLGFLLASFG